MSRPERSRWPWQRASQESSGPDAQVVHLPAVWAGSPPAEVAPPIEETLAQPGWLARVAEQPLVPSRTQVRARARYLRRHLPRAAGAVVVRTPGAVAREVVPVWVGLRRCVSCWYGWAQAQAWDIAVAEAIGAQKSKQVERQQTIRVRRRWYTVTGCGGATGGGWWVWEVYSPWAVAGGVALLVGVVDLIGRAERRALGTDDEQIQPVQRRTLDEGTRPRTVAEWVIESLEAEGVKADLERTPQLDGARQEFRVWVISQQVIKPDHLRAIERDVGAAEFSARMVVDADNAAVREIMIRIGDPLANVPTPPYLATGSVSVMDPLDIGISSDGTPLTIEFTTGHIAIVAMTGGGKTKSIIRAIINRLSACKDAVIYGADLQDGPELKLWGDVIQKKAFSVDELNSLLDEVDVELARRKDIINRAARDRGQNNNTDDEWDVRLGPYLFLIVDELHIAAKIAEIMARLKEGARIWRKYGIIEILATQRVGNQDFGDSVLMSQIAVKIAGPTDAAGAAAMFTAERRDSGYAAHRLKASTKKHPRDAGKFYIDDPDHTEPDLHRGYAPGAKTAVWQLAERRVADGLPRLDGGSTMDAVEVPQALADLEAAIQNLAGSDGRLPSEMAVEHAKARGAGWNQESLAEALESLGVTTRRQRSEAAGGRSLWCYSRDDVDRAMRELA